MKSIKLAHLACATSLFAFAAMASAQASDPATAVDRVLNDVSVGQSVVIPRGTPANAEITWRTGK